MATTIFTGQHPLDLADYRLEAFPLVRLECPGQDNPHSHVQAVTGAVQAVLPSLSADLAIVQGDTSSALGGALAARLAGVPVAHVEAGLRSHDRRRPWPEEEFRIAIDAEAELLFAPTELSAINLRRERARGQIHVTGNTGMDSLVTLRSPTRPSRDVLPRLLVTCHRRENWGDGVEGVAVALRQIAAEDLASIDLVLHPNRQLAAQIRMMLQGEQAISFRRPCTHAEMIDAMLASDLILSDSGGMQEEAAALGVPLLVLRDRTERPEAIACGSIELVGTRPETVVRAVRRWLGSPPATASAMPFGDGRAGERIAEIVEGWLATRSGRWSRRSSEQVSAAYAIQSGGTRSTV
jgi:UDP-N-acetylglucosamine 2-epimerase (non-hydrolysing)